MSDNEEYIDSLEKMYQDYSGSEHNFNFINELKCPKIDVPTLMVYFDNCNYDRNCTLESFLHDCSIEKNSLSEKFYAEYNAFMAFYEKIHLDQHYGKFIELAARIYDENFIEKPELENCKIPFLRECRCFDTLFVDLISGLNFSYFFRTISKSKKYYLYDLSLMTCHLLNIRKNKFQLNNVSVINNDVTLLNKNSFDLNVEILRIKNGLRYIPNFLARIKQYQDIVMPGGLLYFQESSYSRSEWTRYYPYITSQFDATWTIEYEYGDEKNVMDLDSIICKKKK